MVDMAELIEEEEEEEIQVAVGMPVVVQTAPTAIVIATLTPKLAIKPKAKPKAKPQYSFFDLEVQTTTGQDFGVSAQSNADQDSNAGQRYQWSDFILSVISKPVGRELKQAHAGQRSFADLLLGE